MTAAKNMGRSRFALGLLAATMLTPLDSVQAAPGDPIGSLFQVNSFTTGDQVFPAMAMDADGDFVVAWHSYGQDGSYGGVYAQRYNATGEALGDEFRVNTTTTGEQIYPAVAMDADGDFVVTWVGLEIESDMPRIFAQRYDAAGVAQGGEFLVGGLEPTPGAPAVAMNDIGDFVIAYTAATGPGVYDVFAQRFDAAGVAQGGAFLVSTSSADLHAEPAVAMDADGDFVVAWEREISSYPYSDRDILARRYNAAGVAQGDEFRVNAVTAEMQVHTAVAIDADGDFVVAWEESGVYAYTGYGGIFAQRYDAAGVAQGDEFRVTTATMDQSQYPTVAMDTDGDFVVAWMSYSYGAGWGVDARRYAATGQPLGGEFLVSSESVPSGFPAVAMESEGDFAITWLSPDSDAFGIFGQRFEGGGNPAASDFTADGRSDILWRNSSTGSTIVWEMNGFVKEAAATIGTVPGAWNVEDIGDFNGDGSADILWRNSSSGSTIIWQMNGFAKQAAAQIGTVPGGWKVKGVGDFDGDGKADILWRNSSSGSTIIWQMDGFTKVAAKSIGAPPTAWKIEGVDDFDGDGRSDILWRNAGTGATSIWQMEGFTRASSAMIGTVLGGWTVESTGDFDGGGQADILWRNTGSGNIIVWQMSGFTKVAAQSIGTVPTIWHVARVADYDGGGQADILWRRPSTGNTIIWQMDGFTKVAAESIGTVPSAWQVE